MKPSKSWSRWPRSKPPLSLPQVHQFGASRDPPHPRPTRLVPGFLAKKTPRANRHVGSLHFSIAAGIFRSSPRFGSRCPGFLRPSLPERTRKAPNLIRRKRISIPPENIAGSFRSVEDVVGGIVHANFLAGVSSVAPGSGRFAAFGVQPLDGCGSRQHTLVAAVVGDRDQ